MQRYQYQTPFGIFKTIPELLKARGFKPKFMSLKQVQRVVPGVVRMPIAQTSGQVKE